MHCKSDYRKVLYETEAEEFSIVRICILASVLAPISIQISQLA